MKRCLCLLLALLPMVGLCDETQLQSLFGRIRQNASAKFSYDETRTLELADSPWQGQGYMLSGADGSLAKLQLKPKRIIMAIAEGRMYYWDPEQKQRYAAPLGQSGQTAEQITVFSNLLQGHTEELMAIFDFAPEKQGKRWILRLAPKPGLSEKNMPSIEISGDEDERKQQIIIRQPDGESTEYRMVKTSEGQELDNTIRDLLSEATGN